MNAPRVWNGSLHYRPAPGLYANFAVVLIEKGKGLRRDRQMAAAAAALREAHDLMTDLWDGGDARRTTCRELLIELYDAWRAQEPDAGHDAEAQSWRAEPSSER